VERVPPFEKQWCRVQGRQSVSRTAVLEFTVWRRQSTFNLKRIPVFITATGHRIICGYWPIIFSLVYQRLFQQMKCSHTQISEPVYRFALNKCCPRMPLEKLFCPVPVLLMASAWTQWKLNLHKYNDCVLSLHNSERKTFLLQTATASMWAPNSYSG